LGERREPRVDFGLILAIPEMRLKIIGRRKKNIGIRYL
jgi:hypothetical protein